MPHDQSPVRGPGSSQLLGSDSNKARGEISVKINKALTEFNAPYPDAHLQLTGQNPADVDSNYYIFRLGFQTLHSVAELEHYLDRYLDDMTYAIRISREQLGNEGRVIVFIDVHRGALRKAAAESGSWFWTWVILFTIFIFLAYSLRQSTVYSWE